MRVRTSSDFGRLLKDRRLSLGLNQQAVAEQLGVTRQWVAGLERGKARADIGQFLRIVDQLGLRMELSVPGTTIPARKPRIAAVDIDAIADGTEQP